FGRRIRPAVANCGVILGVAVNLVLWLFFKNVFWFWWNAIGSVVTVTVGVVISLVLGGEARLVEAEPASASRETPWKEIAILACAFAGIITFSVLLPRLF